MGVIPGILKEYKGAREEGGAFSLAVLGALEN